MIAEETTGVVEDPTQTEDSCREDRMTDTQTVVEIEVKVKVETEEVGATVVKDRHMATEEEIETIKEAMIEDPMRVGVMVIRIIKRNGHD